MGWWWGLVCGAPAALLASRRTSERPWAQHGQLTSAVAPPPLARSALSAALSQRLWACVLPAPLQLNPRYVPQLEAVLAMPQSVGIVGGRPASSLYFVGFQRRQPAATVPADGPPVSSAGVVREAAAEPSQQAAAGGVPAGSAAAPGWQEALPSAAVASGSTVFYLDPHQVQEASRCRLLSALPRFVALRAHTVGDSHWLLPSPRRAHSPPQPPPPHDALQAACCSADWRSFRAEWPRTMALPSIDPSLALGFYCGSLGEAPPPARKLRGMGRRRCVRVPPSPPPLSWA